MTHSEPPVHYLTAFAKVVHNSVGFSLCCGDPVREVISHLDTAAANAKVASHEFAHGAALSLEQATKLKIQAAEQNAIEAYSELSAASTKLRGDSLIKS